MRHELLILHMKSLTQNAGKGLFRPANIALLLAALFVGIGFAVIATGGSEENDMGYNKLTPEEKAVIIGKGTERPFSGIYYDNWEAGTYVCKRCGAPLYRSSDKFDAQCGWPSFDDEIPGAVKRVPDADGMRTEIVCANCGAHLGHVFLGEGFTDKNTRHCVNSISLKFIPADKSAQVEMTGQVEEKGQAQNPGVTEKTGQYEKAYFAGGCFWGVEYYFEHADGVISTTVGYMGGHTENPTYKEVCTGKTGHAETMEVVFDPALTTYEKLARLFFDIHDPTQMDRQGPDIGEQYRSEIFYVNEQQKEIAEKLIGILKNKGYKVVTKVEPSGPFWKAENYHQDYYERGHGQPYCHVFEEKF